MLFLTRFEVEDRLGRVPQAALVLAERHDRICSLAKAECIAARLPKTRPHIFERSGHMTFAEQDPVFQAVLRAFRRNQDTIEQP